MLIIFCDICIKEISNANKFGTHFKRDEWLRKVVKFKNETGKIYSNKQFKNRMESFQWNDRCFKRLLDEMFIGIIAIGDKAWAPSLGILPSDLFEDDDNATPEENEQNAIDDVLMSDDVRHNIDGNLQTNELQPQP
uniref:Myb/SANT-like domain-containing protein n=1 Tax=Gossypium raimondii TaxID=29730 RepID=A0A0D2PRH4_GOSRA|nr:hypothetical protein B456_001G222100 [Gossypium raimondii]